MKCIVFLVSSMVEEGKAVFSLDSIHHMSSYDMLKKDTNPQEEYTKRSVLIGKDHEWSVEMAKRIKRDADTFQMMQLRKRLNQRMSIHCVKTDYDSFDVDMLKTIFENKIECNEIVEFLKESEL